MSAYGGPPNIFSMKTIQNLSRTDAIHGPYDIIYTGGEALGCTFEGALGMMPSAELREQARKEKIHDCAYLFPKDLLLPHHNKALNKPLNYAVVNSLGGLKTNPACSKAVETADYVAYRDHDPLFPDSAVMMHELFSNEINQAANQVLQDLFPERTGTMRKFVAVQHKPGFNKEELASALDEVSRGLNASIIFFAAGTIPGHDDFNSYKEVARLMEEEAIVYEGENMWNIIGLISRADAVLSTSLHVRIMAFSHTKPRVTWCTEFELKHVRFIALWDTNASGPCVEKKSETWNKLHEHYGRNPDITRKLTIAKYKKSVKQYLESFSRFSGLLRPKLTQMAMER